MVSDAPLSLIYYPDTRPGITRRRAGRGFSYRAPDGTRIEQGAERQRLSALAVPPAYEDVWICPEPNGHLQATGRDARKRKQYRYHDDWTAFRAHRKYADLPDFGAALPRIRRQVARDLQGDMGDRDVAIAAIIALLDRLSLRIGNTAYAEENGSFGATTLKSRHLKMTDRGLALRYTGKGGTRVRRALKGTRLDRVLQRLDDLPGATLVSWVDDDGLPHQVTSDEVNARLNAIAATSGITAKTFRTWNGSAAAMQAALSHDSLSIAGMAEAASQRLCNTPSIARSSYIHPAVIDLAGTSLDLRQNLGQTAPDIRGLRQDERALLGLIAPAQ